MTEITRLPGLVLVTGATGNVGGSVITRLLADGYEVRSLVRSSERASGLLPEEVEFVEGDITDPESLKPAVAGVGTVIHAAGLPEQWTSEPDVFDRVNLGGTINIADAAIEADVECFVHVSTIDVFVWTPGRPFGETIDPNPKHTAYERSKQASDKAVVERIEHGLPARFACPAGVYGPAPSVTPGVNQLLNDLLNGDIPMLLPGGLPTVFNADCADGIIRIGQGPVGTRAILSGPYCTLLEMAELVHDASPAAKIPKVLPTWFAHGVSRAGELVAKRTNKAPLIPEGQLHFLEQHVIPDATHAREHLGWRPTEMADAVAQTIDWLRTTSSNS
ncbi:MAG: NAD-dependent epimerase/dehydratase family protein [Acidimicrobiales bacterium]